MLNLLILTFIGAIPAIHALIKTWNNMVATVDNLQILFPLLAGIAKVIIIWWRKTDLTSLLNMIADDWIKVKTDKELRVMIKCAQFMRVITMGGYCFLTVGITLLVTLPFFGKPLRYENNITNSDKILPLQAYYLYDEDRSPYFEITFAIQGFICLILGVSYIGVDNLLGLLVFHLCGQMENLKEKLINMRECKNFKDNLAFIIKDHIRLIKYFKIVESIFSILILGLLLSFSISFCLFGFLIVSVLTKKTEIVLARFIYLICCMFSLSGHMCIYCLVGEILVTQCEKMYRAAYNCTWYHLKQKEARCLILIMIRSNKPLYITAGKMFPMTMSTFCNLIKTSAGYISVLLANNN